MQKGTGRGVFFAAGLALLALSLLAAAQAPAPKPTPLPGQEKRLPSLDVPRIAPAELPEQCQRARQRADQLRAELEASLTPQAKSAAEQYVAKPGPGVDAIKAWGDYAAAASLMGDAPVAAWAGLKAAEIRWSGDTVTNAGIYLYHLGKVPEALQLLNCAYEMGYRSPYLFEALAVIHQTQGNNAQARQAISQAQQAAPDDTIIETEASFIQTGQPPPPRPPQREPDIFDAALRELEEHAERAKNVVHSRADPLEQIYGDGRNAQLAAIHTKFFDEMVRIARQQVQDFRRANYTEPVTRDTMRNSVLAIIISSYFSITDTMISTVDDPDTADAPILFWADVMGLEPRALAEEWRYEDGRIPSWSPAGFFLAEPAARDYRDDEKKAWDERMRKYDVCNRSGASDGGAACRTRADAQWCADRNEAYHRWSERSKQRYDRGARQFDRIATRTLMEAENEILQARDFAVRLVGAMRFPNLPPMPAGQGRTATLKEMTLQGINSAYFSQLVSQIDPSADCTICVMALIKDQAQYYTMERGNLEETLAREAAEIQRDCAPIEQAYMELLAQEEWQAYLEHLKDRLAWDMQAKTESDWPCEGTIGPLTISTDLNKPGEGKFDVKWKKGSFSATGSATVGGSGVTWGGGVGVSGRSADKTSGVGIGAAGNTGGGRGIGGSASYGPFQGKAKVTLTSKVSPWNSQEYMGIKLKGSAGLGLGARGGKLGAACYPSSGSVTFYPRALYEDAVKYMSTPSTRPSGGGRPR